MSTLITTSQGYLKLGSTLPKLNLSDAWTAISDTDTPESQLQNRVGKRYIDPNEPCFITNKSSSLNQEVHWISDVENDNEERRFMVMRYLALQGYLTLDFTFDHSTNIVNLDPVLFRAMVQYELFAVTLSHATLDKFIALAKEENEIIKARVKSGSDHIRNLQILASADTAEYELVVLHPKYFLPENTHLTRYPDPNSPDQTPKDYKLDANGVLREVPATKDSPRFPSFRFATSNSRRHKWGKLNPYTVLLSAELRFQRYKEAPAAPQLDSEYESLIAKTIELVDLLTWEGEKGGTANLLFGDPGLDIEQALKRKCFRLKAGQRDPFMGGGFPEGMCDVNTLWDPVEAPSLTEREQALLDALEGNA